MSRAKWWVFGLAWALASCAADSGRRTSPDLLALYAEAYAAGEFGFRCVPAEGVGGNAQPRYEHIRRRLGVRAGRIRERLAARFGAARLERIESDFADEMHSIYWTGCDLGETARSRQRYRRLLRELERRTG